MSRELQGMVMRSANPMKVARAVVFEGLKTERGSQGCWLWKGEWFVWDGGRWSRKSKDEMRRLVYLRLEDALVESTDKTGQPVREEYTITSDKVTAVLDAMRAVAWAEWEECPCWLRGGEGIDPSRLVAFEDALVDVVSGQRYERDCGWFSRGVVPCRWDEEAKCPTYERVMGEWSQGEEGWVELRERFYGMGLTGVRYPKILVEFGESGGGKGTMTRLMKKMKGGAPQFVGSSMRTLAGEFGTQMLLQAEFLVLGEGQKMDVGDGREIATVIKMVAGEDDHAVNVKNQEHRVGVVLRPAMVVQSNAMLDLPDDSQGLSSKMLWLRFRGSWRGREDIGLLEKLEGEMSGVAKRWVEAAGRLMRAKSEERWPQPKTSVETLKRYKLEVNRFDAFLEDCFVLQRGHFSDGETVRQERAKWEQMTGLRLKTRSGERLSDHGLMEALEERATWGLARFRKVVRGVGGESLGQRRGLLGLALKSRNGQ